LLPLLERLGQNEALRAVVPVSATKGTNVDRLVGELWALLPAGPPLYGPEMLTDRSERFLAGELIREQLFLGLRQEIPYAVAVVIEEWQERPEKGDVVISAMIVVEREGQRAIILGKKGSMIRELGTRARAAISDLLQRPAHLKLHIKVHPDWTTSADALARYGYAP
jgi:GTP-binding protein Era